MEGRVIYSVEKDIPYFTYSVDQAQIMFDNGKFKIWFENLYNAGHGDIGYAESNDGLIWQISDYNPVLTAGQPGSWDDYTVGLGYIFKENGIYKLYSLGAQNAMGMVYPSDGIHWTKEVTNPVFKLSDVSNGWCTKISYPFSVMNGNDYRIYYSGYGKDNQFHLGVAFGQ